MSAKTNEESLGMLTPLVGSHGGRRKFWWMIDGL